MRASRTTTTRGVDREVVVLVLGGIALVLVARVVRIALVPVFIGRRRVTRETNAPVDAIDRSIDESIDGSIDESIDRWVGRSMGR